MLDFDSLLQEVIEQRHAFLTLESLTFRADLGVRKNDDLGHRDDQVSASTRLPASAARMLRSIRRAANSVVALFSDSVLARSA
jgi:hypothetical protein